MNAIQSSTRISYGQEIHANTWRDEKGMWIELLKGLYGPGNDVPDNLKALRKLIAVELSSACHNELLIVVRNVPSNKTEKTQYQRVLPWLTTLAEYVNIAWSEVENSNPALLGKIALVLECQHELKNITVDKNDTRTSLFVERLN